MTLKQLDQTGSVTKKSCQTCRSYFEVSALWANLVNHCPACVDRKQLDQERERAAKVIAESDARWRGICPCGFRDTNPAKLPNQVAYQQVMNWQSGKTGLLLHGPTGTGKSRAAWSLAEREHRAGKSVLALNAIAGMEYAATFSDSARDAFQWTQRHAKTDLLLLDDVFKARLTDSFEAALFAIISERTERHKPCIITSNDTGDSLLERLSPDRGEPFIRRLREYCQTVVFDFLPIDLPP